MKNQIYFYFPVILLLISIILVGYFIVYKNILIKDVVFSYSALFAAMAMFLMNMGFSLKEKNINEVINASVLINNDVISIDRSKVDFRHAAHYITKNKNRLHDELEIPSVYQFLNRDSEQNREIVASKISAFLIISTLGILSEEMPKWKWISNQDINKAKRDNKFKKIESCFISDIDLNSMINKEFGVSDLKALNVYDGIIFPESTKISITENSINIENKYLHISIIFHVGINYGSRHIIDGKELPFSDFKDHNFIFWPFTMEYNVKFKKENIGSPKIDELNKWQNDIYKIMYKRYSD
ncbi:hypothetical protein I6Z00_004248 [Vibrio parahaemolyticus]|nr:hypothetical protein [Vibrio parahaemolyticus]